MANSVQGENNEHYPWLLITHGKNCQIQTFYNLLEGRYIINMIPDMRNKTVSQASYGWLFLIDDVELDCCLFNPKTKEKIQLPQLERYCLLRCILSKPPTEVDCHVLLVSDATFFCRVGDDKFKELPNDINGPILRTAVNFQGKIYAWMNSTRNFVTVDFENEDIVLASLMKKDGQHFQCPCELPSNAMVFPDHLIESCGELLFFHRIYCSSIISEVSYFRIFKIDIVEMEWKELYSIGDRAIFLSAYGGMAMSCLSEETAIEKDAIYYFKGVGLDQNLYVYHIEDRCHTSLRPSRRVGSTSSKSWIMI